jgi:hypothetical protein
MFIKTENYTINTDRITHAEVNADETVSIYMAGDNKALSISRQEAEELFRMAGRQTLPSVFRKENQNAA